MNKFDRAKRARSAVNTGLKKDRVKLTQHAVDRGWERLGVAHEDELRAMAAAAINHGIELNEIKCEHDYTRLCNCTSHRIDTSYDYAEVASIKNRFWQERYGKNRCMLYKNRVWVFGNVNPRQRPRTLITVVVVNK